MARKKKEEATIQNAVELSAVLEKLNCKILNDIQKEEIPFVLSTGLFSLDLILSSYGGLTQGVSEVFGPPSVGKSHLALSVLMGAQQAGLDTYYINMERGINKATVGCFKQLDPKKVVWVDPDNGQAAINAAEAILRNSKKSLIILDSIPACISAAQLDAKAEESSMAVIARLMAAFMPKAKIFTKVNECHVLLINQVRDNLKSMTGGKQTPGGWSIKFNCDWRIELGLSYPKPWIEAGGEKIGHKVKAEIVKSRHGRPYQTATFPLVYGMGFDQALELVGMGLSFGLIERSGAWYVLPGVDQKLQGEHGVAEYLRTNLDVQEKLKEEIRKLFNEV